MTPNRGTLVRNGEMWLVGLGDERALVADRKGLRDLRALLGRPDVELHVLDLVDAAVVENDLGETLDAVAGGRSSNGSASCTTDLIEAGAANDLGRAETLEMELDRLVDELASQLGLRGAGRRTGGTAERARTRSPGGSARRSRRWPTPPPALARHLTHSVQLGIYASYRPEHPVTWDFDDGRAASAASVAPAVEGNAGSIAEHSHVRVPALGGENRPPLPDLPGVFRTYEFVGRNDELTRLTSGWHDRPGVVIITGEAGAGKTRLIGEFVRSLEPRPTILWGRCIDARLGAYEPFVEPVRGPSSSGSTARGAPARSSPGWCRNSPPTRDGRSAPVAPIRRSSSGCCSRPSPAC